MSRYFPGKENLSKHQIFPGVQIHTRGMEKLMLSVVDMAPGAVVEKHSHPHEQAGMVLEGRALFIVGEEEKTLGPGEVYFIPGGVAHKVVALDQPVRALDCFSPVREDYR
ncbi:MAG: cupin domain-containing protein [Gemmataceae bacterium]